MKHHLKIKQSSLFSFLIIFFSFILFQLERFIFAENSLPFLDFILLFFSHPGVITISLIAVILKEFKISKNNTVNKIIFLSFILLNLLISFADQIFYQVFHSQLSLSFSEGFVLGDIRLLLDSITKEINLTISLVIFLFSKKRV